MRRGGHGPSPSCVGAARQCRLPLLLLHPGVLAGAGLPARLLLLPLQLAAPDQPAGQAHTAQGKFNLMI
jgi:hypothetical protein